MAGRMTVEILGPKHDRYGEILTPQAMDFVASLHREFGGGRKELLKKRMERRAELAAGRLPDFLPETRQIREGNWRMAPVPADLQDRRVEITGPAERKMMINALNSGARVFMADFEDANAPTWDNMIQGQINVIDAIERTIEFQSPDGRLYRLRDDVATLMVRPRGWHLIEQHVHIDGEPVSASLFDFGLFIYHNGRRLVEKGSGPYLYLPKLENHLEARLWNDVFVHAQERLGLPQGTIKATVLIETITAAFEMEEILYELRQHSAGLNAGRWDYIFSVIKNLGHRPEFVLPDRAQVTMTVPFMRAYTEMLVKTCHRRGAHAIGGMAAFVPSRRDPMVNELALARVREDKVRESTDGFDGTWVAHPDLVPVATEVFDQALGQRPNQLHRQREEVQVKAADLVDVRVPGGTVSEAGLRGNIRVGIQYLASWLGGTGAVAIDNLMEDAATAEIARAQVWQWVHHGTPLREGGRVTADLVRRLEREELAQLRRALGEETYAQYYFAEAVDLFEEVALTDHFVEFLTLPAYARLLRLHATPRRRAA